MKCLFLGALTLSPPAAPRPRSTCAATTSSIHRAHGWHLVFKKRQLRKFLKAAQSQPNIIEAMDGRLRKPSRGRVSSVFITERRIREGTDFWIAHRQALDQASIRSGVAPEYPAAILGVETYYGRLTGSYRVLDALATLAFDYPARAKFFATNSNSFSCSPATRDSIP